MILKRQFVSIDLVTIVLDRSRVAKQGALKWLAQLACGGFNLFDFRDWVFSTTLGDM